MDISPNSAVSTAMAMQQGSKHQEVQVTMLKKAIDTQSQNASALIESVPSTKGLPSNLGNQINTTA